MLFGFGWGVWGSFGVVWGRFGVALGPFGVLLGSSWVVFPVLLYVVLRLLNGAKGALGFVVFRGRFWIGLGSGVYLL